MVFTNRLEEVMPALAAVAASSEAVESSLLWRILLPLSEIQRMLRPCEICCFVYDDDTRERPK